VTQTYLFVSIDYLIEIVASQILYLPESSIVPRIETLQILKTINLKYHQYRARIAAVNMDPNVKYLLSLRAIRDRASIVEEIRKAGKLTHFDVNENELDNVVDYVANVIKVRDSNRNPCNQPPAKD